MFHSFPVDHCTGVPDIRIPLYEIVAGDITLPVTLSYHASGLKPHEGSGLAGTNWSLSLEPTVSREIRGTDDIGNYGWLCEGSYHRGTPPGASRMEQINFMDEVVRGIRDSQPDRFTYSLPHAGGSGCGCSAVVLASYILPKVVSGEWKRILFVPTGALLSKVSFNEGDSIPGIAHGVVIEHMEV